MSNVFSKIGRWAGKLSNKVEDHLPNWLPGDVKHYLAVALNPASIVAPGMHIGADYYSRRESGEDKTSAWHGTFGDVGASAVMAATFGAGAAAGGAGGAAAEVGTGVGGVSAEAGAAGASFSAIPAGTAFAGGEGAAYSLAGTGAFTGTAGTIGETASIASGTMGAGVGTANAAGLSSQGFSFGADAQGNGGAFDFMSYLKKYGQSGGRDNKEPNFMQMGFVSPQEEQQKNLAILVDIMKRTQQSGSEIGKVTAAINSQPNPRIGNGA